MFLTSYDFSLCYICKLKNADFPPNIPLLSTLRYFDLRVLLDMNFRRRFLSPCRQCMPIIFVELKDIAVCNY